MCPRCFLEVGVEFLNEDGFGLHKEAWSVRRYIGCGDLFVCGRTCIFETQSEVMVDIFEPVTPGGLSASID